jgi:hypothetical protein
VSTVTSKPSPVLQHWTMRDRTMRDRRNYPPTHHQKRSSSRGCFVPLTLNPKKITTKKRLSLSCDTNHRCVDVSAEGSP